MKGENVGGGEVVSGMQKMNKRSGNKSTFIGITVKYKEKENQKVIKER